MLKHVICLVITMSIIAGFSTLHAAGKQEEKQIVIKIATAYPPGNESTVTAEKFAELVKQYSNGKITAQVFSGGSMGGERDTIQAAKIGSVQGVTSGMMPVHMMAVKYGFLDAPYVIKDYDHFKRVWAGKLGKEVREIFIGNNLQTIGIYYRGVRHITANKPIRNAGDLKGIKMRVPQDPSWVKIWTALGTLPTVVALPELFTALQTGVAEASEGPASQLLSYRLHEVQKYLVLSGHMTAVGIMNMNKKFLDELSEGNRSIVLKAATDAVAAGDEFAQNAEKDFINKLIAGGMQQLIPDKDSFRKLAEPAISDLFKTEWNVTNWDEVLKY